MTVFCQQNRIPVHPNTGYPVQPRPHDLVPRDLDRLNRCVVTPKVDGLEAFLVGHDCGCGLLLRSGEIRMLSAGRFPYFLVEGELIGERLFVAYDCVHSSVLNYTQYGRYATRHAAARSIARRIAPRLSDWTLAVKPVFPVIHHPHRAIRRCVEWAEASGVPCDGVVFVDAFVGGYLQDHRLWKLKHTQCFHWCVPKFPIHKGPGPHEWKH